MDIEKVVSKIQEAKKFCTTYRSKERSLDCDRQNLEQDIKTKTYYLQMIEDYTTMVSEVDERIQKRQRRMQSNSEFVEEHRDKFNSLRKLLDQESEKLLTKINRTVESLEKERQNESGTTSD